NGGRLASGPLTVPGPARDVTLARVICSRCQHEGLQFTGRKGKPRAADCLCCISPASPDKHGAVKWHSYVHRGDEQDWLLSCCSTAPGQQGSLHRADGLTEDQADAEDAED